VIGAAAKLDRRRRRRRRRHEIKERKCEWEKWKT
jgi:hypothetical protein